LQVRPPTSRGATPLEHAPQTRAVLPHAPPACCPSPVAPLFSPRLGLRTEGMAVGPGALHGPGRSSFEDLCRGGASVRVTDPRGVAEMHRLRDGETLSSALLPSPPLALAGTRPRTHANACVAVGLGVAEIARHPSVRHDPRTVAKVLGRGVLKTSAHGGTRRDILGDDGRVLLSKLVRLFPQTSDKWRASAMSKVLQKDVRVGVVRSACQRLGFTSHRATVLYTECAADCASLTVMAVLGLAAPPPPAGRPAPCHSVRTCPAVRAGGSRRRCTSSSGRLWPSTRGSSVKTQPSATAPSSSTRPP
jgi:hypothetical protein